jgi:SUMO ligase MMS21 Smc5/6 complex component
VARAHQSLVCPVSQRQLVQPVYNPACRHVYSQAAITQLLRAGSADCPVAGCRQRIAVSGLLPDLEMEQRLERVRNRIF